MSIEDIDEEGLLDCQNNQATEFNDLETDPLVEEQDRIVRTMLGRLNQILWNGVW